MKRINIYELPFTLRLLIFGLIGAIVFYLLYLWDISDLSTQLIDAQQKEQAIKEQYESILSTQVIQKNETAQFPKVEALFTQWQNKLITYSDVPQIINEILKSGASNHLYFSLFTPGQEVKVGNYFKIPIKVITMGSYHDLANFLSQVANLPFIVVIDNFTITSENKNDTLGSKSAATASVENLLTAEITLEVYYRAENNEKK